jgi:hypothetical protein
MLVAFRRGCISDLGGGIHHSPRWKDAAFFKPCKNYITVFNLNQEIKCSFKI